MLPYCIRNPMFLLRQTNANNRKKDDGFYYCVRRTVRSVYNVHNTINNVLFIHDIHVAHQTKIYIEWNWLVFY